METKIIAEVAQTHDGSLGQAHAFIDSAAKCGAHYIKFQTHIAEAESTPAEPWRVKFSKQDASRYDYWKRMEFTEEQWFGLKKHADEAGIGFISSPFSVEAVDLLTRVGTDCWKVASGEINNSVMFEKMAETGLPFILSTGMSSLAEIDETVNKIQIRGLDLTLLQCTSMYPTPAEKLGLNLITEFRERYNCKVGLSDHSGTIYAGLAAAALGASIVEVHFTLSKEMFGPDVPVSLDPAELKQLVEGTKFISLVNANPVNKDAVAEELQYMRKLFTKSIMVKKAIEAGETITEENITLKKPGTGLPPEQMKELLGKKAVRRLEVDHMIRLEDLV